MTRLILSAVCTAVAAATLLFVSVMSAGKAAAQTPVRQAFLPAQETNQPALQSAVQQVDLSGPFHDPSPKTSSLSTPAYAVERSRMTVTGGDTLQIHIRFVAIDSIVREQIYSEIDSSRLTTTLQRIPQQQLSFLKSTPSGESRRDAVVSSPGAFTYATISKTECANVFRLIEQSESTRVIAAPRITTNENRSANVSMLAQKPFVVGISQADSTKPDTLHSDIQVLNHGTEVEITGEFVDDKIRMTAGIQASKIIGVSTERVFGFGPSKTTIQIPMHQVTCVTANAILASGESLMMDPYLELHQSPDPNKADSFLGTVSALAGQKLAGRKKPSQPRQYMLVVLTPQRQTSKVSAPQKTSETRTE